MYLSIKDFPMDGIQEFFLLYRELGCAYDYDLPTPKIETTYTTHVLADESFRGQPVSMIL